jgi:hypothetical protein
MRIPTVQFQPWSLGYLGLLDCYCSVSLDPRWNGKVRAVRDRDGQTYLVDMFNWLHGRVSSGLFSWGDGHDGE